MNDTKEKLRTSVTIDHIMSKIEKSVYTLLPETTTTICQVFMKNGYVVIGTSACVDKSRYNQALGEKYSFENAINKLWPLEGYLLSEELFNGKSI